MDSSKNDVNLAPSVKGRQTEYEIRGKNVGLTFLLRSVRFRVAGRIIGSRGELKGISGVLAITGLVF